MKHEEFVWWLKGYRDAMVNEGKPIDEEINEKLNSVTEEINISFPWTFTGSNTCIPDYNINPTITSK